MALYVRSGGVWDAIGTGKLEVQDGTGVSNLWKPVKQLYVMRFNTTTLVHEWKYVGAFTAPTATPSGNIHEDGTPDGSSNYRCYYVLPSSVPADPSVTAGTAQFYQGASSTGPWYPLSTSTSGGLGSTLYSPYEITAYNWVYADVFYTSGAGAGPTYSTAAIQTTDVPPYP